MTVPLTLNTYDIVNMFTTSGVIYSKVSEASSLKSAKITLRM